MKLFSTHRFFIYKRLLVFVILAGFILNSIPVPVVYAQMPAGLPAPGTMVTLSPSFTPPLMKGLSLHPDKPFQIDFIVYVGDDKLEGQALKEESVAVCAHHPWQMVSDRAEGCHDEVNLVGSEAALRQPEGGQNDERRAYDKQEVAPGIENPE